MRYAFYYLFVFAMYAITWTGVVFNLLRMALFNPAAIPRFWELYDSMVKPEIAQAKKDIWKAINE